MLFAAAETCMKMEWDVEEDASRAIDFWVLLARKFRSLPLSLVARCCLQCVVVKRGKDR